MCEGVNKNHIGRVTRNRIEIVLSEDEFKPLKN